MMTTIIPSSEDIERQVAGILFKAEFRHQGQDVLQQLLNSIGIWLSKLKLSFLSSEKTISIVALVVWIITLALLIALVVLIIFGLWKLFFRNPVIAKNQSKVWIDKMTSEKAFLRAEEFAGRGDFSSGVKWIFLSCLWMLQEAAFLSLDETKTNRQYIEELWKRKFPAVESFRKLIIQFNLIRYGGRVALAIDYQQSVVLLSLIRKGGDPHPSST